MEKEQDAYFSVTRESRAERLDRWSREELITLRDRLADEVAGAQFTISIIDEILDEDSNTETTDQA